MKKETWKRIILVNSVLWILAAMYFIYSSAVALIQFDGHQFLVGLGIVGFFTLSQVTFVFLGD